MDARKLPQPLAIVGGGIAGLCTALAAARAGASVHVLEQAAAFSEVGAGIQLGPNAVRALHSLGLGAALDRVATRPARLEVRNAQSARVLAALPLGDAARQRYGADYVCLARADLQALLLQAVQAHGGVQLHLNAAVHRVVQDREAVWVEAQGGLKLEVPVLVGADGLWSQVRPMVCGSPAPQPTGHLAYRAMVPQAGLPAHLRSQVVTAWLGPRFHVVQYPVRAGAWLNVVAIVQNPMHTAQAAPHPSTATGWDTTAPSAEVRSALAGAAPPLRELLWAIDSWRMWPLFDRPPMAAAAEHAKGRIALVGDAAHPMRPYLAQGAGMAVEDAVTLVHCLAGQPEDVSLALHTFAAARWQRNAQVQARAVRNGRIFHLHGPLQWGRDLALRVLGARLLDMPWLYGFSAPISGSLPPIPPAPLPPPGQRGA